MLANFLNIGTRHPRLPLIASLCLIGYVLSAGIFSIPNFEFQPSEILLVKRVYLFFTLVILSLCIDLKNREFRISLIFLAVWIGLILVNFFIHGNLAGSFNRVAQSLFIVILIGFICSNFETLKRCLNFSVNIVIIISILSTYCFVLNFLDIEFTKNLASGFGGNRVNFSIWLSEINLLILLCWYCQNDISYDSHKIKNALFLFCIASLLCLQIASGGRLGICVSAISLLYVSFFKLKNNTIYFIQNSCFFILGSFFAKYSPTVTKEWQGSKFVNTNILRELDPERIEKIVQRNSTFLGQLFDVFDNILSYRLTINVNAIHSIDWSTFVMGEGINNFMSFDVKGQEQQVHNVFLNIIGEMGIVAGLFVFSLTLFPIFLGRINSNTHILKFGIFIWLIPANLQPHFYVSQISSSLVYWICFGFLLYFVSESELKRRNYEILERN